MVYLIFGKAGAGKTHYAVELTDEFLASGKKAKWLDGDVFRVEHDNQDYSDEGRFKNLQAAAIRAAEFEKEGYIVVCSFVAPKEEWRNMMRSYWKEHVTVYIPGGGLWKGTNFEAPYPAELGVKAS